MENNENGNNNNLNNNNQQGFFLQFKDCVYFENDEQVIESFLRYAPFFRQALVQDPRDIERDLCFVDLSDKELAVLRKSGRTKEEPLMLPGISKLQFDMFARLELLSRKHTLTEEIELVKCNDYLGSEQRLCGSLFNCANLFTQSIFLNRFKRNPALVRKIKDNAILSGAFDRFKYALRNLAIKEFQGTVEIYEGKMFSPITKVPCPDELSGDNWNKLTDNKFGKCFALCGNFAFAWNKSEQSARTQFASHENIIFDIKNKVGTQFPGRFDNISITSDGTYAVIHKYKNSHAKITLPLLFAINPCTSFEQLALIGSLIHSENAISREIDLARGKPLRQIFDTLNEDQKNRLVNYFKLDLDYQPKIAPVQFGKWKDSMANVIKKSSSQPDLIDKSELKTLENNN
jgi:hypothetical protein